MPRDTPHASATRPIWCCACDAEVLARLTDGGEVYPSRSDLVRIPFWRCDGCGNFVGCHHRHDNKRMRKNPLGVIPTREIRNMRKRVHRVLDPLWQRGGAYKRRRLYAVIADRMGIAEFHTAQLRTVADAEAAYRIVCEIKRDGLPDEGGGAVIYRKTCKAGHLLIRHAYFVANGFGRQYRRCRLCHIERNRRYKARVRRLNPIVRTWI